MNSFFALSWSNPPGFDIESAMERLGNAPEIYVSLVKRFHANHKAGLERLHHHLRLGDLTRAADELHTLRGSAGVLGATDLADFTRTAEASLRLESEAMTDQAIAHTLLMEQLDTLMASTLATLERIIAQIERNDVSGWISSSWP
ncbi:MAG: Hpt domain-containing protein [Gammaproteobacteria bacterium]|nr:Hpt domain-containing protein [Gammaproteobacteria bacterium]MCP5196046.1 Hpt domain-containing protein [Gammaproteobacteria bacterium]